MAIGMAVETRLAEEVGAAPAGLAMEIAGCLERLGLPVRIPPELDRGEIYTAMHRDKKKIGGRLRFALPERIGDVIVTEVAGELVERILHL